ncbi:DUF7544 domain-containing protein [Natrialbaceae archaeon AArc-T1-2]|uniref:DUF7544 domain-containing protein n=1 Tax=Natrialbaceae archaeon AArc-T1-2 TaxID=3053904 RepID=UPI00255A9375|nr:hypothetical protein [Natrialbaceae archaeon AArc-T1-2]WIV66773.1 hypothetical protein QQ977_13915 [Natrialbaceae archaeon AArc-T1-2]
MHAVDDLGDAIDLTREFLTPVRLGLWLRLMIVVFFVGGLGFGGPGVPTGDVGMVVDDPAVEPEPIEEEVPVDDLLMIGAVVAVAGVSLWLLFALLRAIMDFVFIESLRTTEVRVRRYARENLGSGLRLFLFRALVGLVSFGIVAVPAAAAILTADGITDAAGLLALLAVLAVPLSIAYVIVMRFTTVFVAPVMLLEDRGVLSAWGRFWPTLRSSLGEYAVYLLLVWILQIVISIAVGILAIFGLLVIGIPVGLVAFVLLAFGTAGIVLAVIVALVGFVSFLLFVALIEVPVYSYLRYYALLVLGDTNRELDLIPDQRETVRDEKRADRRTDRRRDRHDETVTDRDDDEDGWESSDWDETSDWDSSEWDDSNRESSDWDDDRDDDRNGGWR